MHYSSILPFRQLYYGPTVRLYTGSKVKLSYVHMRIMLFEIHSGKTCPDGTLESGNVWNGIQRISKQLWSKLSPMGQFLQQLDSHLCGPLYSLFIIWDSRSVNCERIKVFGTKLWSIAELRVHEMAQVGIVSNYPTWSENRWFDTDWNSCLVSKMFWTIPNHLWHAELQVLKALATEVLHLHGL